MDTIVNAKPDNAQDSEHHARSERLADDLTKARVAELEWVISEAICFPSAALPDWKIKRLHWLIEGARESHRLRGAERRR